MTNLWWLLPKSLLPRTMLARLEKLRLRTVLLPLKLLRSPLRNRSREALCKMSANTSRHHWRCEGRLQPLTNESLR